MNIAQAKCIPLQSYLERQGHRPKHARQNGRELWYHSPIRQGDKTPSFKIDTLKNIWYDHGAAKGGTIIDLICELCACDVRDALHHLDRTGLYSPVLPTPATSTSPATGSAGRPDQYAVSATAPGASRRVGSTWATDAKTAPAGEKEKGGALQLISEGPLRHPALLQYLAKRGIDLDIASGYLSQIDFKGAQGIGTYFGVGYPAGDGFEVRSALFKGFVGTAKTVSFHDRPKATCLQVFEGFMDFLSYLTKNQTREPKQAVLVLNSTNLWRRSLPYINNPRFAEIRLYLDNDAAGDAATQQLIQSAQTPAKLADMRSHYAGYEDLNAWLIGQRR